MSVMYKMKFFFNKKNILLSLFYYASYIMEMFSFSSPKFPRLLPLQMLYPEGSFASAALSYLTPSYPCLFNLPPPSPPSLHILMRIYIQSAFLFPHCLGAIVQSNVIKFIS